MAAGDALIKRYYKSSCHSYTFSFQPPSGEEWLIQQIFIDFPAGTLDDGGVSRYRLYWWVSGSEGCTILKENFIRTDSTGRAALAYKDTDLQEVIGIPASVVVGHNSQEGMLITIPLRATHSAYPRLWVDLEWDGGAGDVRVTIVGVKTK